MAFFLVSSGQAAKARSVDLFHFRLYAVREFFNLFRLLEGIERHDGLVVLRQVLFQFRSEFQHLLGVAPDLKLALLIGRRGLFF